MTQFDAVNAVYAFYRSAHGVASSTEVRDWHGEQTGDDLDVADVSRTLLRAQRNGRLFRHTSLSDDGHFQYEYGIRRKGYQWLAHLARLRRETRDGPRPGVDLDESEFPSPDAEGVDDTDGRTDGAWDIESGDDDVAFCDVCDAAVSSDDRFCRMCGVRFDDPGR